jgi:hypothetical protein
MIRAFDPQGEDLVPVVLPRIFALLDRGACRRSDMITLDPKRIGDLWTKAVSSLNQALELMAEEFGCLGTGFIPFADMIPPLAGILSSQNFLGDDQQRARVRRWYWRAVFSQSMVSSTETKIARVYREWTGDNGWLNPGGAEPESVREFALRESVLDDVSRIDSGIYRGVMTLLLSSGVQDLGKGNVELKRCSWGK